jgi:glycosyltransferase involved in cell wall biosynthesis
MAPTSLPPTPLRHHSAARRSRLRLAWLSTEKGIPYGGTKGAAVHLRNLVTAVAGRDVDILLIVGAAEPGAQPPPGVEFVVLPGPGVGSTAEERLAWEPRRARWLQERLRAFGADALYERIGLHSAFGARAAAALGIPHLVEMNAPLPWETATYRTLRFPEEAERLERTTLESAALVLAVSEPLAAYARSRGARRVWVVPNAAHADVPQADPAAPPVAVFTGTLRPWHGVDTIAVAWERLGAAAPPLLVVGDGPGREALEHVGAQVTGAVAPDAVPALLSRGSIGLAPYAPGCPRYFSPLKVFEYLAGGLAVVAGRLPGVEDVVGPSSALLVPPGDAGALAEAVGTLAADRDLRAALGAAGRRLILSHHTWDHRAATVVGAVERLVARKAVVA